MGTTTNFSSEDVRGQGAASAQLLAPQRDPRRTKKVKLGKATSRKMMTTIEYKGFRIEVSPVGKGWRASIFPAGSNRALGDSPSNLEKSRTDEIVAEAKRIIDARLGPRSV
jgi:hypothetical protein